MGVSAVHTVDDVSMLSQDERDTIYAAEAERVEKWMLDAGYDIATMARILKLDYGTLYAQFRSRKRLSESFKWRFERRFRREAMELLDAPRAVLRFASDEGSEDR